RRQRNEIDKTFQHKPAVFVQAERRRIDAVLPDRIRRPLPETHGKRQFVAVAQVQAGHLLADDFATLRIHLFHHGGGLHDDARHSSSLSSCRSRAPLATPRNLRGEPARRLRSLPKATTLAPNASNRRLSDGPICRRRKRTIASPLTSTALRFVRTRVQASRATCASTSASTS